MFGVEVNYVAVLICGVASTIIGFSWYSNALFGNAWMKLSGVLPEKIKQANSNMPILYGTMFVASLVMAYVLANFVFFANAASLTDGAIVGFWTWLGFVATTFLTGVLYEGKPLQLYYINAGYHLVTLMVMGAILVSMG